MEAQKTQLNVLYEQIAKWVMYTQGRQFEIVGNFPDYAPSFDLDFLLVNLTCFSVHSVKRLLVDILWS